MIGFVVCAFGWYGVVHSSTAEAPSSKYSDSSTTLDGYKQALSEANENIEQANDCIDDSYGYFDEGSFDDGMSNLSDCSVDTVSEP